jgi:hypothetical protein
VRTRVRGIGLGAIVAALLLALPAIASAGQIRAGAAVVDASWHVGASSGQHASDGTFASPEGADVHQHTVRRVPSYGVHARLQVRALVVEGVNGRKVALVKNDLYIPQDLLWRRAAQLLEAANIGIGRDNFTMAVTHDHSSPYYTTPSWGVWTFQDVFDFRMFEHYARKMADAVIAANRRLVPVRVGASVTDYSFIQRNVPGPTIADDGSPAGFPNSYSDHDLIVVRFDEIGGGTVANLVNYAVHPEDLDGTDLISADFLGPLERMTDRELGGVTIYTQGSVGQSEPEENRWHDVHDRAYFYRQNYAQSEAKARHLATAIADTSRDVERGTPDDPSRFVPFRDDFAENDVSFADRWFPGPLSHPYPGVSSCRTDQALAGDPRFPVVGLPDCRSPGDQFGYDPPLEGAGITTDDIQEFGIPVPENYSAPSYTGLEENVSVHLQAFRIGDILFTVCSCEQWADQSKNIKTRTDRVPGNQHNGYDWSGQCSQKSPDVWDCPHPSDPARRIDVSNTAYRRMNAQVNNDAGGWDDPAYAPFAESEPTDPAQIKGNYTHDDTPDKMVQAGQNAQLGYGITVPIGMANDYAGYIVTYREYQRGDHYRKALNAWGPHASDYMATRMIRMGRWLRRLGEPGAMGDPYPPNGPNNAVDEWPGSLVKTQADLAHNDRRAEVIGEFSREGMAQYERSLPDDLQAGVVGDGGQPSDVERFGTAFFTWVGGSNFVDNPLVKVQRFSGGEWRDYADQSGEVIVTLKFPPAEDAPAYRVRGSRFEWTAHFETFVSSFDLGDRPRATPAGSYRFVVEGQRQQGGSPRSYRLVSREFLVTPWSGIAVEGFGADGDTPGFRVGPRRTIQVDNTDAGKPKLQARLGPIDYPDTYNRAPKRAKYISSTRHFVRDPAAPNDPDRFEWYCHAPGDSPNGCAFRPWLDVGDLERVVFTFVTRSGKVDRVRGHKVGGTWVAERSLRSGEGAYIESGDACDAYGNYNGAATGIVGNRDVVPDRPPAGFSCVPRQPPEDIPPGGAPPGGSSAGGGSNPLGLPPRSQCIDRRKFRFKIHQPPRQRVVNVNVFINGKRRYSRRGRAVKTISIKRLPTTGRYVVRIVALTNRGNRVISTRVYKGCKKSKPKTRVRRGRGARR